MTKNINIRDIPDNLYFKALELKGKLQLNSWAELLKKLMEAYEQ